jgi:hypothetical protein
VPSLGKVKIIKPVRNPRFYVRIILKSLSLDPIPRQFYLLHTFLSVRSILILHSIYDWLLPVNASDMSTSSFHPSRCIHPNIGKKHKLPSLPFGTCIYRGEQNNGNTKKLRNRIRLCWLHWKYFNWHHWIFFFHLFRHCSSRVTALVIVLSDSPCERIEK